jgi:hypothetical protein
MLRFMTRRRAAVENGGRYWLNQRPRDVNAMFT